MSPNRKAAQLLQEKTDIQNWGARRASRSKKYKTTSKHVTDYIVLDFETTGFRAGADRIIQIGALKYINHERVEVMNTFINPERHIPATITRLTGISNEMVEWAPTSRTKSTNSSNSSAIFRSSLITHRLTWVFSTRSTTSKASKFRNTPSSTLSNWHAKPSQKRRITNSAHWPSTSNSNTTPMTQSATA